MIQSKIDPRINVYLEKLKQQQQQKKKKTKKKRYTALILCLNGTNILGRLSAIFDKGNNILASARQNLQWGLCNQQRFRSACTSTQ